jgi:hypothetical protein
MSSSSSTTFFLPTIGNPSSSSSQGFKRWNDLYSAVQQLQQQIESDSIKLHHALKQIKSESLFIYGGFQTWESFISSMSFSEHFRKGINIISNSAIRKHKRASFGLQVCYFFRFFQSIVKFDIDF